MSIYTSGRWTREGDEEEKFGRIARPLGGQIGRSNTQNDYNYYRKAICELIDNNSFVVYFQPILSSSDGAVYGYEALTRITSQDHHFQDVSDLFKKAREVDVIAPLDLLCMNNAIREAAMLGLKERGACLFINVSPEMLLDPANRVGITGKIAEKWGLPKERVILELTEETAIEDYWRLREAIAYCRGQGYKIAIDDFGAGHGGLKMLSVVEPEFVKIDRHFISNIDKTMIKFNLVESIVTVCHRIGIKVIAERVEQQGELDVVINLGVELLQGYLLGTPSPSLAVNEPLFPTVGRSKAIGDGCEEPTGRQFNIIGDICRKVDPIWPAVPFTKAVKRFTSDSSLRGLPVVEKGTVLGMLHRERFTEQQILGRFGYGMYLNSYKDIGAVMEHHFLVVESSSSLENVAQRVNSREAAFLYDDLIVTKHGKYLGTVAVSDLLEAMTERSICTAKNSNPLSGLPGNVSIQKEIETRLSQSMQFDVCYIDLDHFKPYNDCYGFEKGDLVIQSLARIISDAVDAIDAYSANFVGHIGGDDFIVITRPQISVSVSEKIVKEFSSRLPEFHGIRDYERRAYTSKNRKGEIEKYDLLSLSIGIVSTKVLKIDSYAQLASIASDVKKFAKMQKGFSIVRDRRIIAQS